MKQSKNLFTCNSHLMSGTHCGRKIQLAGPTPFADNILIVQSGCESYHAYLAVWKSGNSPEAHDEHMAPDFYLVRCMVGKSPNLCLQEHLAQTSFKVLG